MCFLILNNLMLFLKKEFLFFFNRLWYFQHSTVRSGIFCINIALTEQTLLDPSDFKPFIFIVLN